VLGLKDLIQVDLLLLGFDLKTCQVPSCGWAAYAGYGWLALARPHEVIDDTMLRSPALEYDVSIV